MKNNTITAPKGFFADGVACGIKAGGKLDLGLLVAERICTAAAVFTTNRFCGSPIVVGREHLRNGKLRAIVVNSGCSNVATGKRGVNDAKKTCTWVAKPLSAKPTEILPSSTGVIGRFLPMPAIERGIYAAFTSASSSADAGQRFAKAIMTTDTRPKEACERIKIGKESITVAGCCKGSGMIAPNMATMLAFLTTDAGLPSKELQAMLGKAADATFNRVTVDECQSTSDTAAILASGMAATLSSSAHKTKFADALIAVCKALAYKLAEDGEGATRVIEVVVNSAKTPADAHAAARAIAVSPLVKTAVHGGDPNWGRIVQAIGATSVAYKPDNVVVAIDKTVLFRKGAPVAKIDLKKVSKLMQQKRVLIRIDLGAGKSSDAVLTCDFSREYIAINADYTT